MQQRVNSGRPYLNKYNIMLCTLDEGVTYLFINIAELACWIYKRPGKKELNAVSTRIYKVKIKKEQNRNIRCCIVIDSVKYEVNFVRV